MPDAEAISDILVAEKPFAANSFKATERMCCSRSSLMCVFCCAFLGMTVTPVVLIEYTFNDKIRHCGLSVKMNCADTSDE
jgi:hypothetical protein